MNSQTVDRLVYQIEHDELELTTDHIFVKAMQHYLQELYGEWHDLEEVRSTVIWNCKQFSINYATDLINAIESYKEAQNG